MRRANNQSAVDACFEMLVAAALAGVRCPGRDDGATSDLTTALARAGRISVEIYALNYRRVVILTGEHAGKATAAAPSDHKPWKVIGRSTVINGKVQTDKRERPQPSAPRILSSAEIQGIK